MSYLVDTDWVIDFLAARTPAVDLIAQLLPNGVAISIVTDMEIVEGIRGSRDPSGPNEVFQRFLTGVEVFGIDRIVAERAADIRLDLRRRTLPIDHRALDLLIAATAVEHDLILVSRNARRDGNVPDLQLHRPA